jgi:hypothetical protein
MRTLLTDATVSHVMLPVLDRKQVCRQQPRTHARAHGGPRTAAVRGPCIPLLHPYRNVTSVAALTKGQHFSAGLVPCTAIAIFV